MAGRHGARRPELPLTSISALFIAFVVSLLVHLIGGLVVELIVLASQEAGRLWPGHWPSGVTLPIPMRAVVEMYSAGSIEPTPTPAPLTLEDAAKAAAAAAQSTRAATDWMVAGLWTMIAQVLAECVLVFFFVSGRGAELLIDRLDLQGQGWVYKSVVRPHRHGQTPVAHVLTALTNGQNLGVGYMGVVEELRQGGDGELKVMSLAKPEAFVYELTPVSGDETKKLKIHEKRDLPGVVVLEAATVRNIVIHNLQPARVDRLAANLTRLVEAEIQAKKAKDARTAKTAEAKAAKSAAPKARASKSAAAKAAKSAAKPKSKIRSTPPAPGRGGASSDG